MRIFPVLIARAWLSRFKARHYNLPVVVKFRPSTGGGIAMSGSAVSLKKKPSLVRERVSDEEWQLRCELAAAHRLVAHFVFVDMTYNHISARVPGAPNHFLVKADNVFMEQVTASNLVKYDVDGNKVMESAYKASPAAYNLHAAVMKARPDIMA